MLVHPTPKAESFMLELMPKYFRQVSAMMEPLDASEQSEMLRLLGKVREGIAAATRVDATHQQTV